MRHKKKILIVGSGATGILSALRFLKSKEYFVEMIDPGDFSHLGCGLVEFDRLADVPADERFDAYLKSDLCVQNTKTGDKLFKGFDVGVWWKRIFDEPVFCHNEKVGPSVIRGGNTNYWGASRLSNETILDYFSEIELGDVKRHLKLLEEELRIPSSPALEPSKNENNNIIKCRTLKTGYLAVDFSECDYCQLCLIGCPKNCIWQPLDSFQQLLEFDDFFYRQKVLCERVQASENTVTVSLKSICSQETFQETFDRVILAAGPISTAMIVGASNQYPSEISMAQSSYQRFCFVDLKGLIDDFRDNLVTMIKGGKVTLQRHALAHKIYHDTSGLFVQLYPISKSLIVSITRNGTVARSLANFIYLYFPRTFQFGQGYYGSAISPKFRFNRSNFKFELIGKKIFNGTQIKLQLKFLVRMIVGWFFPLTISKIQNGVSNHNGATFPLASKLSTYTNLNANGELEGLEKVHIVDASILPEVRSGPITMLALVCTSILLDRLIGKRR
jgi:NAD-dependent dihydropyrimidine dehydrogenase PreA subunit